jgi:thiol-disulfide isomerase/thioredoxin
MKNIVLIVIACVMFSCNNSEKETEKTSYVIFNGDLKNSVAEEVVIRGNDFEKKIAIPVGGKFIDTLHIATDGYYEFYVNRERTAIYLEKGKKLSVSVDANEFDESIKYTGDLAKENNYLAAKYLLSEKEKPYQEVYIMDETGFIAEANNINNQYLALLKSVDSLPQTFKDRELKELEYTHVSNLENFQEYHRYFSDEKDFMVSPAFYEGLKGINYSDTTAYRNSVAYQKMVDSHINRLVSEQSYNNDDFVMTTSFLKLVDDTFPDGYAKNKIMTNYLQFGMRPDESLEDAYTIYKNSNPDKEDFAKLTERYTILKTITAGNPSPAFNYENHKGGNTSLADLKGKYVYVDVWATWCGPCIREIPALKEVEKDYHNKNVAFVSISIDEEKDYETWKKMVSDKDLGGVQLMADNNWKSKFVEDYAILGIPRFILIDPQGNIVSADAPRPSDPKLRTLLDKLI